MNKGFINGTKYIIKEGSVTDTYTFLGNAVEIELDNSKKFICGIDQELFLYTNDLISAKDSLNKLLYNGYKVTNVKTLEGNIELADITVGNDEHSYFILIDDYEVKVHNISIPTLSGVTVMKTPSIKQIGTSVSVSTVQTATNSTSTVQANSTPATSTPAASTPSVESEVTVVKDTTIYIPSTRIDFTVSMMKPSTRLYAFFDGRDVTQYVTPTVLKTDAYGNASGYFTIPNNSNIKFAAGAKEFKLTDSSTNTSSSSTTSATATYIYTGTTENPDNPNIDAGSVWDNFNVEPIIQSFYCGEHGGMYVSRIGLYFYAKDLSDSILFQIREISNDKVTSSYIGGSNVVINPKDITISTDALKEDPSIWVTFPNPIYLQEGKEYAIYMITNSSNYILHMIDYGQQTSNRTAGKDISVRSFIKYIGINNWVRDNSRGIKFKVQKCKFNTSATYNLNLSEDITASSLRYIPNNSLSITNGSNVVTVYDENHSFNKGSRIYLTGLGAGSTGGVANSLINGLHEIDDVTWNSYSFNNYIENDVKREYPNFQTTISPLRFGTNISTDYDIQYDRLILNNNAVVLSDTEIKYNIKSVSGRSLDGTETPYIINNTGDGIEPRVEYIPGQVKKIASYRNAAKNLSNTKSLRINAAFRTNNENISPVIDKFNTNAIAVEFVINNQNSDELLNTANEACARRIFKTVNLFEQATGIMVSFYGSIQAASNVSLYYKTLPVASSELIDDMNWTLLPQANEPNKSADEGDFQLYKYMVESLEPFKAFKIKLVMNSTDSTKIPWIGKFAAISFSE